MPDFLLELRSEEIPARMQVQAKADLARLFTAELAKHGLKAASLETFVTPRRLALIACGLPDATDAVSEELKGPRTTAPEAALDGFLRKTGLTRDQLTDRDGIWFASLDKPGRPTVSVLSEAIPAIVRAFPWPKSMRWSAASLSTESLRWVRPLQGIVALLGETIVPFEIGGVDSGAATLGHRFVHPGPITIGSAADYVEKLRLCHVIVHFSERCALIRDGARAAAEAAGLTLVEDEGLVAENAGLTEWPVPLLGRFDASYLSVPQEIIQLTARVNQKYFVCSSPLPEGERVDSPQASGERALDSPLPDAARLSLSPSGRGKLANVFVCTANIDAPDGGAAIVEGNRKVLAARLADAKFFWDNDLRVPLDKQAEKLSQIVFHERLGTVADKVERVARLARWLCEEGIVTSSPARGGGGEADGGGSPLASSSTVANPLHHPAGGPPPLSGEELASLAERAARLCKADLVTGTVGEFPELQGVIGGHLARAQGEEAAVADAIRDHYKPVGQGDEVPTAPVTVAVSLADKLDNLVGFFAAEMPPTGSKDPFALRRAMLSEQALTGENGLRFSLADAIRVLLDVLAPKEDTGRRWIWGEKELAQKDIDSGIVESPQTLVNEEQTVAALRSFFADRLKVQQREAGVRHDLIDAVFALGGEDDLVRLLARVRALQAFVETPEGTNLLAGYKRAANILKKEGYTSKPEPRHPELVSGSTPPDAAPPQVEEWMLNQVQHDELVADGEKPLSYTPLDQEKALIDALDSAEPQAAAAIEREDFDGAMRALAALRGPIDAFFEGVTVNDDNRHKRAARLALLARFRDAVHRVADFSKIKG